MSPQKIKLIPGILSGLLLSASAIPATITPNSYAEGASSYFDLNAQQCVIDMYNADSGSSATSIEEVDFDAITGIECPNQNITNFRGVVLMKNLLVLDLSGNSISSIDLSQNKELYWLDLNDTDIAAIDLSGNNALRSVYLENNSQLRDVILPENAQLLTGIYLLNNPNLHYLDIPDLGWLDDLEIDTNNMYLRTSAFAKVENGEIKMDLSELHFLDAIKPRITSSWTYVPQDWLEYNPETKIVTYNRNGSSPMFDYVLFDYAIAGKTSRVFIDTKGTAIGLVPIIDNEKVYHPQAIDDKKFYGETIDSDDYLDLMDERLKDLAEGGYADFDYANLVLTKVTLSDEFSETELEIITDEDLRQVARINSADGNVVIKYYYETKSPKTPDTGFFTNEDGSVNVSNVLLSLAGLSISAFVIIFLAHRISKKSSARRF